MKVFVVGLAVASAVFGVALGAQQNNTEEFARRQYDSGLSFMQNRRYAEALKDFQAVVDSFPKSTVADNALLEIALYHLDVTRDVAAAQVAADRLLKEYPDTDSAPMAHVVSGRLTMEKGHASADVDAALASFERVARLFPGDDAVPTAEFYAGDTLRTVRRNDEALDRFRRVAMEYPRSIWSARATLAAAVSLVQASSPTRAFEDLQRVRQQFPGTPEAAEALNDNTLIYRLYVRPPAQPAYTFAGRYVGAETSKFKDVVGVAVDDAGRILLGHQKGIAVFDAKAALVKSVGADEPSTVFLDERGRLMFARQNQLIAEGAESVALTIAAPDGKVRAVEEVPSVVVMSNGDRIVSDRKAKTVVRVSPQGKYLGNFTTLNTERMAINQLNDVAMIDRDSKAVVIVDRDGKPLTRILQKGMGYEFDNPVDLKFDPLGHLYVLDRGRASIFVFGPKNRLITTITVPEKEAGAFQKAQAFALDPAGRLYIFDDRSQRIQVYQ